MATYEVIYRDENPEQPADSPLHIEVVQVSRDAASQKSFLQMKARNISDAPIGNIGVEACIVAPDGGSETVSFALGNAEIAPGEVWQPAAQSFALAEIGQIKLAVEHADGSELPGLDMEADSKEPIVESAAAQKEAEPETVSPSVPVATPSSEQERKTPETVSVPKKPLIAVIAVIAIAAAIGIGFALGGGGEGKSASDAQAPAQEVSQDTAQDNETPAKKDQPAIVGHWGINTISSKGAENLSICDPKKYYYDFYEDGSGVFIGSDSEFKGDWVFDKVDGEYELYTFTMYGENNLHVVIAITTDSMTDAVWLIRENDDLCGSAMKY